MVEQINTNEGESLIRSRIRVTQEHIAHAREVIRAEAAKSKGSLPSASLVEAVVRSHGVELPSVIGTHSSRNPGEAIEKVAEVLSWRLAAAEAILSLIHSGIVLPMSSPAGLRAVTVKFDTAPPNSGGHSGCWTFDETAIWLPGFVRIAPSQANA